MFNRKKEKEEETGHEKAIELLKEAKKKEQGFTLSVDMGEGMHTMVHCLNAISLAEMIAMTFDQHPIAEDAYENLVNPAREARKQAQRQEELEEAGVADLMAEKSKRPKKPGLNERTLEGKAVQEIAFKTARGYIDECEREGHPFMIAKADEEVAHLMIAGMPPWNLAEVIAGVLRKHPEIFDILEEGQDKLELPFSFKINNRPTKTMH